MTWLRPRLWFWQSFIPLWDKYFVLSQSHCSVPSTTTSAETTRQLSRSVARRKKSTLIKRKFLYKVRSTQFWLLSGPRVYIWQRKWYFRFPQNQTLHCIIHRRNRFCIVLYTAETFSALIYTPQNQTLHCVIHRRNRLCIVLYTAETDSALCYTPQKQSLHWVIHCRKRFCHVF